MSVSSNAVRLDDVVAITERAQQAAGKNIAGIRVVTDRLRVLALNAQMEASRAGERGRGFGVVAQEVKNISAEVDTFAKALSKDLGGEISQLDEMTRRMAREANSTRLIDLALNAIELIDRNLYERTCDVRWWATDSAVTAAAAAPTDYDALEYACKRIAVILRAYTVYLDIWLCDAEGHVIANGKPEYGRVRGQSVADRAWFKQAMALRDGDSYVAADVGSEPALASAQVATYAASVRLDGETKGCTLGVMAVHFDWQPQAQAIVRGVRLSPEEWKRSRVLLVDGSGLLLASSDGRGALSERLPIKFNGRDFGVDIGRDGELLAFHRTPGYETYAGLGWYGVIVQKPQAKSR